ncbi:unnamed protein product [Brachionus calyciflorus]|uniref:G-protein coupled receptors family 1 profile domain-containing protein n=1 Tax=Brachionus calyciflorus TaxID=104777 RepID=A0A813UTB5_9BILA|nr:unnamed protein product [Brachionus calyciflorus]
MANFTNFTDDYNSDDPNIKYKLYIIVPIIWSSIIFFGIIGNGLIIYIILKRRLYKNSCTNCYIINVSIADLCFTLACVPVTMTAYVYNEWIFGSFWCHFQNLIMFSSVQAACLTLTAMTVDRYLAVLYPFKSMEYRTRELALMTNIIIWIASLILNIPYFIYYNEEKIHNANLCISKFPNKNIEIALTIYTVLISYVLPLLTIIFCYKAIILNFYSKSSDQKLVEESKNFSSMTYPSQSLILKKNKKNSNDENLIKINSSKQNKHEFYTEDDIIDTNESNNLQIKNFKKSSCCSSTKNNSFSKSNKTYNNNYNCTIKNNINSNQNGAAMTIKKQKLKILLLIATVSITFAVTWLPAHVIQIWKVVFNSSFPYSDAMYIIKVISHTLTYSNSLINPFIYVFIGAKFRSHIHLEFSELYQVYCLRRKRSDLNFSSAKMSTGSYVAVMNKNRSDKFSSITMMPNENISKKNSLNIRRL